MKLSYAPSGTLCTLAAIISFQKRLSIFISSGPAVALFFRFRLTGEKKHYFYADDNQIYLPIKINDTSALHTL